MALETGRLVYRLAGTSTREKLLQNLTNDVCRSHLGLAFRLHVQAAFMHGVMYAELLALLRFVAPYAGYPAAADALGRLREVAVELGVDVTDDSTGSEDEVSLEVGPAGVDPWLDDFLVSRVDRAWSEGRLSRRERALVALTTDLAMRTPGHSFRSHVRMAMDAGVGPDSLRDAVRFCAELGVVGAVSAYQRLDAVLAELSGQGPMTEVTR